MTELTPEALQFFKDKGRKGGRNRWQGKTKAERDAEMEKVRAARNTARSDSA